MITAWRVVRGKYVQRAFDGEGARRAGGRFNSKGTPVVYTSDSLALSLLEVMVHMPGYAQLRGRVALAITFEDRHVEVLGEEALPPGWRVAPPPRSTQRLGDAWVREERSLVLRVPSVIVAYAFNYIINPKHPDFAAVDIGPAETIRIDPRLMK